MADHELTPEEALRSLAELFSNLPSAPSRQCRKYFLEYQDGEPVFRRAASHPAIVRDEIELALDPIFEEEFGDDVVPQKLAKSFPILSRGAKRP